MSFLVYNHRVWSDFNNLQQNVKDGGSPLLINQLEKLSKKNVIFVILKHNQYVSQSSIHILSPPFITCIHVSLLLFIAPASVSSAAPLSPYHLLLMEKQLPISRYSTRLEVTNYKHTYIQT